MEPFILYLLLFSILVVLGELFHKSTIPIALILVIFGMLLSFIPFFPPVFIDSKLVLNVFLPLLIYQISSFSSWREMRKYARTIALLSIGHVVFITVLVAVVAHALIPQMNWPLAFVLGAIVSPPDSVAIVAIAEKVKIPRPVFIILEGEGLFNDAAALTLFRIALVAAVTNQFSLPHALGSFLVILIGESIYGFFLGHLLGALRIKIKNTALHAIASWLTPFLAYIPVEQMGGSGIIATAVVGFIIGNHYSMKFTSEYRLSAFMMWPMAGFAIQGIIFLLVGLDLRAILERISSIPVTALMTYVGSIVAAVIIGRFVWVYGFVNFLPRFISSLLKRRDPYPPWKYPFIISWSGIRGGVSLAAALAVPPLSVGVDAINIQDLLVFIAFSIIFVTLVLQGLSLPFLLKKLGVEKVGESEQITERVLEIKARIAMANAAIKWLTAYKSVMKDNKKLADEMEMHLLEYKLLKNNFIQRLEDQNKSPQEEALQLQEKLPLLYEIIEVEKEELSRLWQAGQISLKTRNKLMTTLDHQVQRHMIG